MSAGAAAWFFYKAFAVSMCTAFIAIAAGVSVTVGLQTLWKRYRIGEQQEMAAEDMLKSFKEVR